jgi:hypothetical protein
MKQGTSKTYADHKVEPKAHHVSIDKVSEIGVHQHRTKHIELYKGRGYEAPKTGVTQHHCGSQGKH